MKDISALGCLDPKEEKELYPMKEERPGNNLTTFALKHERLSNSHHMQQFSLALPISLTKLTNNVDKFSQNPNQKFLLYKHLQTIQNSQT